MGSLSLLQGIFPTQGSNPGLLHCGADSSPAEPPGKPKNAGVGSLFLFQRIFPPWESHQDLLHCRRILHQLSQQGSPLEDRGHGNAIASLPTAFAACSFPDDHKVVGVSRTQGEGQCCSSGVWGKSQGPQGQFLLEGLGEGGCTALPSASAPPGFLLPRPVTSSVSFMTFSHSDPCFFPFSCSVTQSCPNLLLPQGP